MKKYFLGVLLSYVLILAACSSGDSSKSVDGKLVKDLDITEEQATQFKDQLSQVGIENYISMEHDELLDNAHFEGEKGYRMKTKDASNIIIYTRADSTLFKVRYADVDLYADGEVKSSIKDLIITNDERTSLQISSQEAIKTLLKSPSTAKFPNITHWKFGKENGVTIVQSYVDAQNSFGAETRSEFQFKIKDSKVISLIMDGKEYMQQ